LSNEELSKVTSFYNCLTSCQLGSYSFVSVCLTYCVSVHQNLGQQVVACPVLAILWLEAQ